MFQIEAYKNAVLVPACLILMGSSACAQFFPFFRSTPTPTPPPAPSAPALQPSPSPGRGVDVSRHTRPHSKVKPQPVMAVTTPEEIRNTRLVTNQMADVARKYGLEMAFRLDPTLRRGDVVVVNSGLHVYSGDRGRSHRAGDFRPLAFSQFARKPQLVALQKVGKYEALTPGTRNAFAEVLTIRPNSRFVEVKAIYGFKEVKTGRN